MSTDFYGPQYARIDGTLAAEIRREVFGDDIGQESWRSAAGQAEIADLLALTGESHVLDVACGAGGPSVALALRTGYRLSGLDVAAEGIAHANALAAARGLGERVRFAVADCAGRLPFADGGFDAVLCVDSVCHLPDRFAVLAEWARLLGPGGGVLLTDPFVVTGAIAKHEIDGRAALGADLYFVRPGLNEEAIGAAGLTLRRTIDRSAAGAEIASRWREARQRRAELLEREEGRDWFERRQCMLAAAAELMGSGRLSRLLYLAGKPS